MLEKSEESQFEILEELHSKLREIEEANIDLKKTAIENVQTIMKLTNAN